MKNGYIIKNIRRALMKQLVFPALLLIAALTILLKTPRDNFFNPRPLTYKSGFEDFYNRELPYVTVTASDLKYSGLDYVADGYIQGHYYYTLTDGRCQLYILAREAGTQPAAEPDTKKLWGRLVKLNDRAYQTLLKDMAANLNWTAASLAKISAPYAVTTVPYPVYFNILYFAVLYGCILISLLDILYSLLYIAQPLRSPTFRYLGTFGEIRTLLPKVEMEIKHVSMAQAGNIYLTPSYIVNVDAVRSIILPLKSVTWIYYHRYKKHLPFMPFKVTYTLHIAAEDGRTYAFTKKRQEDLDYIIEIIRQRKSDVLLGYSGENRNLAKRKKEAHIRLPLSVKR